ncbi:unnamed protein product [Rhizophagus irregularis]|nr:unnamed protein product [Rhizophagus irregularis]CAB5296320.1 unnamed protein product [Rhizophagus irregularis]
MYDNYQTYKLQICQIQIIFDPSESVILDSDSYEEQKLDQQKVCCGEAPLFLHHTEFLFNKKPNIPKEQNLVMLLATTFLILLWTPTKVEIDVKSVYNNDNG